MADIFDRLDAIVVANNVVVSWRLSPDMVEPGPYSFQLQQSEHGLPNSPDWQPVGLPVVDAFVVATPLRDDTPVPQTHYRVILTTSHNAYPSQSVSSEAGLPRHDWLLMQAVLRRHTLQCRSVNGSPGWLLVRRRYSTPVTNPDVIDDITGDILSTVDTTGVGTDKEGGYFSPQFWPLVLAPGGQANVHDEERGQVDEESTAGLSAATVLLDVGDVWVDARSNVRYAIHARQPAYAIRNRTVLWQVELRRLSPTAPVHTIAVPALPPDAPWREDWL